MPRSRLVAPPSFVAHLQESWLIGEAQLGRALSELEVVSEFNVRLPIREVHGEPSNSEFAALSLSYGSVGGSWVVGRCW